MMTHLQVVTTVSWSAGQQLEEQASRSDRQHRCWGRASELADSKLLCIVLAPAASFMRRGAENKLLKHLLLIECAIM